jgi:hypothetical protein
MTSASSLPSAPTPDGPDWVGWWRVRRYGGAAPEVPTYYEATPEHWDVIKAEAEGLYVARHPILSVEGGTIHLKDEGAPDAHAEQWAAEVEDGRLRVAAATGPHEGVVGVAERIETDPRVLASS